MISLATGFPSPDFHPAKEMAKIAKEVFADEGGRAVLPRPPRGCPSCARPWPSVRRKPASPPTPARSS